MDLEGYPRQVTWQHTDSAVNPEEAVMGDVEEPGPAKLNAQPVAADGADLGLPTADLLRALGLLPKKGEDAGPSAAIKV